MNYLLLSMHMKCDAQFMFGHAIIAGKLAAGNELNTYQKYKRACAEQKVMAYSEIAYQRFMFDTQRKIGDDYPQRSELINKSLPEKSTILWGTEGALNQHD
jgi:hypothetical protein